MLRKSLWRIISKSASHPSMFPAPLCRATDQCLNPAFRSSHWAWRLLPAALFFALLLCAPTPSFAAACGGDGQRACCNGDLEFSNTGFACNSGTVYVGGCTDPNGCGCSGGLITSENSLGMCYTPQPCGGAGQRACCNGNFEFSNNGLACDTGLVQLPGGCDSSGGGRCVCGIGNEFSSGTCVTPTPCGEKGQRACCVSTLEYAGGGGGNACNQSVTNMVEVPGCAGDCTCGGNTSLGQLSISSCTVIEKISEPTTNAIPTAIEPDIASVAATSANPFPQEPNTTTPWTLPQAALPSGPLCPAIGLCGYADMHVHMFANLAHGGATLAGEPFEYYGGVNVALGQDYGMDPSKLFEYQNLGLNNVHANTGSLVDKNGATKATVDSSCPDYLQKSPLGNLCAGQYLFHGDHTLIDTTTGGGTNDDSGSNLGIPLFNGWPQWTTTVHQQVYYKWLERAWLGGLRLMVNFAVTNEALCKSSTRLTGIDCSLSMPEIDAQIRAAQDFQAWLDTQYGGPGKGWFQIVTDPAQAANVIEQGKLAVVLGIEVDNLFNCHRQGADGKPENGEGPACDTAYVQAQLAKYYMMGVRHIFPIHNFDNAFGTPAAWQDAINVGNYASEGGFWDAVNCPSSGYGFYLSPFTENLEALLGFGSDVQPNNYPTGSWAACHNTPGLTPLGYSLIGSAMNMGMIIDVDHMSINAFNDTIGLAKTVSPWYPGITASHVQFFDLYSQSFKGSAGRHERMRTKDQLNAISATGGMIAVMLKDDVQDTQNGYCPAYGKCALPPLGPGPKGGKYTVEYNGPQGNYGLTNNCRYSTTEWAQAYLYGADTMGAPVAMGSDFNGVAGHVGPRFGSGACGGEPTERAKQEIANNRLVYPFYLPGFGSFDKQVSGQRSFDFNTDGLAHIGLLPDMVADMKNIGVSNQQLQPLFGSAQAYIDMWSKVKKVPPTFLSANTAAFNVGDQGSFTVNSLANPPATYSESGALPAGITFTSAGVFSGTAAKDGTYPITITASNGIPPDARQSFTLVVNSTPGFTSPDTAIFTVGVAGSFTVTTTVPTSSPLIAGSLPTGVGLSGLTYFGTPAPGSGGVYQQDISVFPTGGGPYFHEFLKLIVLEAPAINSANQVVLKAGAAASFQVKTFGYPAPALNLSGQLPPDVEFSPATGMIAGSIRANGGGVYKVQITAKNDSGQVATQTLTITVTQTPVFTSAATATFTANQTSTFNVTATGYPAPTFKWSALSNTNVPAGFTNDGAVVLNNPSDSVLGKFTITAIADTGFETASEQLTFYIKDGPKITWNPAPVQYGNPLDSTQLNATAAVQGVGNIPGAFVYSPSAGTALTPGLQTLSVVFNPADTTKYFVESAQSQVNVIFNPTQPFSLTAPQVVLSRDPNSGAVLATVTVVNVGSSALDVVAFTGGQLGPLPPVAVSPTTLSALPSGNMATFVLTFAPDIVGSAIGPPGTATIFSFSAIAVAGGKEVGTVNTTVGLILP
jgi:microsomal dipeptidase-like Zn-dependent dipeptidase